MKTKENALATLESARAKALELLKRDPKRSAIAIGATVAAVAVLSAEEGGIVGFGSGGTKTHEIRDLNGPGGQMVAATLETPAGWEVKGGVNWHNPGDPTDPYKVSITARSGDGKRRVEFLPSKVWKSGTQSRPMTAEGAVRQMILPKLRPGARVVKVDSNPAEVAKVQTAMRNNPSAQAPGTTMNVDAVIAEIEYEEDGTRYRENVIPILLVAQFNGTPQQQMMARQVGTSVVTGRFHHLQVITSRAPAGEFEKAGKEQEKIIASLKYTDRWQSAVARYNSEKSSERHYASMGRLKSNFEAGQRRHADRTRSMDLANQNWWDGQHANDASHRNWMNGHLGQSDFHNPHTGMIESHSDTGGRMWQDGFGNTFETEVWQDDPRMNPNAWGTGLEEMQRVDW